MLRAVQNCLIVQRRRRRLCVLFSLSRTENWCCFPFHAFFLPAPFFSPACGTGSRVPARCNTVLLSLFSRPAGWYAHTLSFPSRTNETNYFVVGGAVCGWGGPVMQSAINCPAAKLLHRPPPLSSSSLLHALFCA